MLVAIIYGLPILSAAGVGAVLWSVGAGRSLAQLFRLLFCRLHRRHLFDGPDRVRHRLAEALEVQLYDKVRQREFPRLLLVIRQLPEFFGFKPSSNAILTWACERWNRCRASIHGCNRFGMTVLVFGIEQLAWLRNIVLQGTTIKNNQ
jgi:hypothetical protein